MNYNDDFDPECCTIKFSSRSRRPPVSKFTTAVSRVYSGESLADVFLPGIRARLTRKEEACGEDGRGFEGAGLDHGVFAPLSSHVRRDFRGVHIV